MDGSFNYIEKLGETLSTTTPARTFRYDLPTFVCTYCERICRVSQEALDESRAQLVASFARSVTDDAIASSFDVCLACALDEHHDAEVVDYTRQRREKGRQLMHDTIAALRALPDATGELHALLGLLYRHRHALVITRAGDPMVPLHVLERADSATTCGVGASSVLADEYDEHEPARVLCSGEEDERGRATCEGDDVRTCAVKIVTDGTPALFTTNWCESCRRTAELNGYRVRVGGACNA